MTTAKDRCRPDYSIGDGRVSMYTRINSQMYKSLRGARRVIQSHHVVSIEASVTPTNQCSYDTRVSVTGSHLQEIRRKDSES